MHRDTPLIIFDGNCQGQHLSAILSASGIGECYAIGQDLGFLPSHLGHPCRYIDEEAALELVRKAKEAGRTVIQGSQSTPTSDQADMSYTSLVDKVVRYPHLQFFALSPDECTSRFGPRATPKRVFEMDLSVMAICQTRSATDVDFVEFIRGAAHDRPLFHTSLHPGGELTALAVRSFARQLPNAKEADIERAATFLERSEGMNFMTYHPIAESVTDMLGFHWGESYRLYSRLMNLRVREDWDAIAAEEFTFRDAFPDDTWLWLTLTEFHLARKSRRDVELCYQKLLELSPGNLHFWLLGLNIYSTFSDRGAMEALMHRASCFFQGQRIYSQLMAYFYLHIGNAELAAPYAWDYHSRTPDRGDGLVPILLVLWHLSRHDDIRQIIDYERVNSSESRLAEIRANLNEIPDLRQFCP